MSHISIDTKKALREALLNYDRSEFEDDDELEEFIEETLLGDMLVDLKVTLADDLLDYLKSDEARDILLDYFNGEEE